jgi:hypothetical protein
MIGLIVLVFLGAVAAVIIAHIRERRSIEAATRFANDLTDKEIERNISADVASKDRPYQPGAFGNDEGGRSYVAGIDGAVRRVHIVPTEDGGETLLMHRKLGKAERKKRKKAIRLERERDRRVVVTVSDPRGEDRGPFRGLGLEPRADGLTAHVISSGPYDGPMTTDNRSKADCERHDVGRRFGSGPYDDLPDVPYFGPIITNVSAE